MYNVTSVKEAGAIVAALEDIKNAMEGGYPEPTSATQGQVLTADGEGGADWEDASGVDMTGAQAGQVLTAVEDGGGNLVQGWTTPSGGLPATAGNSNKVLKVNNAGSGVDWVTLLPFRYVAMQFNLTDMEYNDKSGVYGITLYPQDNYGSNIIALDYATAVFQDIYGLTSANPTAKRVDASAFDFEFEGAGQIWAYLDSTAYTALSTAGCEKVKFFWIIPKSW